MEERERGIELGRRKRKWKKLFAKQPRLNFSPPFSSSFSSLPSFSFSSNTHNNFSTNSLHLFRFLSSLSSLSNFLFLLFFSPSPSSSSSFTLCFEWFEFSSLFSFEACLSSEEKRSDQKPFKHPLNTTK